MLEFNQKGLVQPLILVLLLIGIVIGTFLVQQQTQFFSKAVEKSQVAQACSHNPKSAFCILLKRACGQKCLETESISTPATQPKYFLFQFNPAPNSNEDFIVRVENPQLIQQLTDDLKASRRLIISGIVQQGNGGFNHNGVRYWNWYLGGTLIAGESFIEVCDARPSQVEQDVHNWIGQQYCPWENHVAAVYDFPPPLSEYKPTPTPKISPRPSEEGSICIQVIVRACLKENPKMCKDFPTPCDVPEGWVVF